MPVSPVAPAQLMKQLRVHARTWRSAPAIHYGVPTIASATLGPVALPLYIPGLVIERAAARRENAVVRQIKQLAAANPPEFAAALDTAIKDGTLGAREVKRLFRWRARLGLGVGKKIQDPVLNARVSKLVRSLSFGKAAAGLGAVAVFTFLFWPVLPFFILALPVVAIPYTIYRLVRARGGASAEAREQLRRSIMAIIGATYQQDQTGLDAARNDRQRLAGFKPRVLRSLGPDTPAAVTQRLQELDATIIPGLQAAIDQATRRSEIGKTYDGRSGRYQITDHLGGGGMGTVYKATRLAATPAGGGLPVTGIPVAVKVLLEHDVTVDDLRQRFEKEIEILRAINHPNVVRGVDSGTTGTKVGGVDQPFFVMELVEGEPLSEAIRQGTVAASHAPAIVLQIAEGLRAGYAVPGKQYVHRDVKPHNVMLGRDPLTGERVVKLTDFGLVKDASDPRTMSGVVMGSFNYMAPECQDKDQIDFRSDIYALGIIFYQLLSGRLPHAINNEFSRWLSYMRGLPLDQPMAFDYSGIPPKFKPLIQKMTHHSKDKRYGSYDELIKDLQTLSRVKDKTELTAGERVSSVVASALVICDHLTFVYFRDLDVDAISDAAAAESKKARLVEILDQLDYTDEWYNGMLPKLVALENRIAALQQRTRRLGPQTQREVLEGDDSMAIAELLKKFSNEGLKADNDAKTYLRRGEIERRDSSLKDDVEFAKAMLEID